tara:strand:+ start:79 stop:798 length:720 start_codon:yes stop_codon:yes gene_type:complete
VIIAAGMGSRLSSVSNGLPKILVKIWNVPLLELLLDNCYQAGIDHIIIVTGHNSHIIEEYIPKIKKNIKVTTIFNPDWKLANGVSVLRAKSMIPKNEEFLISMSDHYYTSKSLIRMKNHKNKKTIASVGSDYKIKEIYDIDDGMKIKIDKESKLIKAMSKNLNNYNAIDCGLFKCQYEFFNYLKDAKKRNECSLSDACNLLINQSLMGSVDIKNDPWIDIDTPESLSYINDNPDNFKIF